jgi:hypothetical protein
VERARTPCPLCALYGGHLRSFTANHGQPKPLLKGSVVASHVVPKLMMNAVPPAGLRSRMVRGLGAKVVGHQGGAVFRHVGA